MMDLLRILAECEKTQHWPPEQEQEEDLILPEYAVSDADSLEEFAEAEEV